MSHTFSDEAKAFEGGEMTERIPFGVTEVKLVGVTANEAPAEGKADFLEITVVTADDIEDNARLYFSEKAEKYSFATLKQIVVHNAKSDSDKEKARMAVENCADLDALAELINKRTVGGQLWITKYFDPNRNYLNSQGQSRRSINTNVFSYAPKPNQALLAIQQLGDEQLDIVAGEITDDGQINTTVPSDDAWDK